MSAEPPTVPMFYADLEATRQWIDAAINEHQPGQRQAAAAVAQALAALCQVEATWLKQSPP